MVYKELALMLTDKCTAECRFCGLGCSPRNNCVMTLEKAKDLIDQMKGMGSFTRLGISGGEPFIYPELVIEILEYAKEVGIEERTVATNGYWGGWSVEKIDDMLYKLEKVVTSMAFSHDAFHSEYVKSADVWRATLAADQHHIEYTIHVADVYGEKGAGEFLASCDENVLFKSYTLYQLASIGKAKDLPQEIFIRCQKMEDSACLPGGIMAVGPDGTVYPCCCPGIYDLGLTLGNINEKPLEEILTKSPGMKWINVMACPDRFIRMLRYAKEELGIELPEKAVNGCELCCMLFRNPGVKEKLQPFIEQEYLDLVKTKLFGTEG